MNSLNVTALVNRVLEALEKANLAINGEKSEVMQEEVTFLGHVVGHRRLAMEEGKVEAVRNWEAPGPERTKKDIQMFLGFCNYYRHFSNIYSEIAKPLTNLTGEVPWKWEKAENDAFEDLKKALTTAPLLQQFNRQLPTRLETDASNMAVAGILEQKHGDRWLPVEYYSSTLTQTQRNWLIHDKELWAIFSSLDRWRPMLAGVPFNVYTDHNGLKYFDTKPRLNMRQATDNNNDRTTFQNELSFQRVPEHKQHIF